MFVWGGMSLILSLHILSSWVHRLIITAVEILPKINTSGPSAKRQMKVMICKQIVSLSILMSKNNLYNFTTAFSHCLYTYQPDIWNLIIYLSFRETNGCFDVFLYFRIDRERSVWFVSVDHVLYVYDALQRLWYILQTYGGVHADHLVHSLQVNLNQTTTIILIWFTFPISEWIKWSLTMKCRWWRSQGKQGIEHFYLLVRKIVSCQQFMRICLYVIVYIWNARSKNWLKNLHHMCDVNILINIARTIKPWNN